MKNRPSTNPPFVTNSLDTEKVDIASILVGRGASDLEDATNLFTSDEKDMEVLEELHVFEVNLVEI